MEYTVSEYMLTNINSMDGKLLNGTWNKLLLIQDMEWKEPCVEYIVNHNDTMKQTNQYIKQLSICVIYPHLLNGKYTGVHVKFSDKMITFKVYLIL